MGDLIQMRLSDFMESVAAKRPTPGGGSVSATVAAFGASLGIMAARFSPSERIAESAARLEELADELAGLVDADAEAYELVHSARKLPRGSEEECSRRTEVVQNALWEAAQPPLKGMKLSVEALELLRTMAPAINPNLLSDVGTSAVCLDGGVRGCRLNVQVNARSLRDRDRAATLEAEAEELAGRAVALVRGLLRRVRNVHDR